MMSRSHPLLVAAPLLAAPFAVALTLTLTLAAAGPAAAQDAINPGYWETTSKVTSPFPTHKTERRCIKPQDVAKFMEGKINHIYTCTYPTREIAGGKIRLEGSCATRDGPAVPISGSGTFSSDAMHIDARIVPQIGGLSVPIRASTDAKRLSETCPVEGQG